MKYFMKFILPLLCVTVWTGYKVSAYQNNNSSSQTDNQASLEIFYQDVRSFFDVVDQSGNALCRADISKRVRTTDLFRFYLDKSLLELAVSRFDISPSAEIFSMLDRAQYSLERTISEISLEDVREELEVLQVQLDSCLENGVDG